MKAINAMQGIELNGRALKIRFKKIETVAQAKPVDQVHAPAAAKKVTSSVTVQAKTPAKAEERGANDDNQVQAIGDGWDATGGQNTGEIRWQEVVTLLPRTD